MTTLNNDELRKQIKKQCFGLDDDELDTVIAYRDVLNVVSEIIKFIATHDQQLLEAILEGQNEYELDMHGFYDKDVSNVVEAVPVEHIKSVFNKEGGE